MAGAWAGMPGTQHFPSLSGDPLQNARASRRNQLATDFGTTTDMTMRWPRDVYEAGQGARWRPKNVRRPEPGFTLTFMNDIGTKAEQQPPTTDALTAHYTLEQQPGRKVPGRDTTEAFSQYNAPPSYALNYRPDERYALQKDKNQSVLPQQCGLPGPRVRVLQRGGGAKDWQQHKEEVMGSEGQYKLESRANTNNADFAQTAYRGEDGKARLPPRPVQNFTVRFQNDIGTKEYPVNMTPDEMVRSNVPLGPAPEYNMLPGGYDTKQSRVDVAAGSAPPERGAGKANEYAKQYDIINSGPMLNAVGGFESFAAATQGDQWCHSGNNGSVRRRHMAAGGRNGSSMPSYHPTPGLTGAWETGRDSTYKNACEEGFGATGLDKRELGMSNGWQKTAKAAVAPPWGTD